MFQGDPRLHRREAPGQVEQERLGMEARSILRSIRTEHAKLGQSDVLAPSDLHYFRARYNYYKLSLLRLDEPEKKLLEPVLRQFKASIIGFEQSSLSASSEQEHAPFLAAVESQATKSSSDVASSTADTAVRQLKDRELVNDLREELRLVHLALQASASGENNRTIAKAIERAIEKIESL